MRLVWLIIPLVLFSIVGMSDSFGQATQWSVQFGSDSFEGGRSISVDSSGNVYVTGTTSGSLFDVIAGESDAFIAKYDHDGNEVWAKQFGSDRHDGNNNIALDSSGNAYVTGYTRGDLFDTNVGMIDAYVAKYDTDGNEVWAKQFGSDDRDIGFDITADSSGNVYVTGHTNGDLFGRNTGAYDVFVVKYNPDGVEKWAKQFGNDSLEEHGGITTDSFDNVYVTGVINDNPSGNDIGSEDVFVTKYAKNGIEKWAKQFGSISFEGGNDITVDPSGNMYITGTTSGSLFDTLVGEYDAFVIKYDSQMITSQPSLKHQIENAIPIDDITCKNENHLLVERTDKKLACVYLDTAKKLDWKSTDSDIIILSQSVRESLLMRYQDIPEVIAFYATYVDAQASVRQDHISYFAGSNDSSLMRMNVFFGKDQALEHIDLHCYYQKVHQFEIPQEDIADRLEKYDCQKSRD